jgi:uncharacterized protein
MLKLDKRKIVLALLAASILVQVLPVRSEFVSFEWRNEIENYLRDVDTNTTAEIVVCIVQSLMGHGIRKDGSEINEIVSLGVFIFNGFPLEVPNGTVAGIGKKGKDNGVLILVAVEEREWRIEVGYGLEGYLTDIETNVIAQQFLVPRLEEEKYGEGLYETVVGLAEKIPFVSQSEKLPIRERYFYENPGSGETPFWVFILVGTIFGVVLVIFAVLAYLARKGKIKMKSVRSTGGRSVGGRPSGGGKGGGGRSGGGGAKGKW